MSRTTPLTYGVINDSKIGSMFALDPATTTGLTFGYKAGTFSNALASVVVSAGTVTLTDDATNEVNMTSGGAVSANGAGGVLYDVTTASGVITAITDKRGSYSW